MTLHHLWLSIKRAFGYDHNTPVIDHVPVQAEKNYADKLAEARDRHGREFHVNERKPRETPASYDLQVLNAASETAKPSSTVTKIKDRSR